MTVRIRSITCFLSTLYPTHPQLLALAEAFIPQARRLYQEAGNEVQTVRLATSSFANWISPERLPELAQVLELSCIKAGFNYLSLGPALPSVPESYLAIPGALRTTENTFFSAVIATPNHMISLPAIQACAEVIHAAAGINANGFTNLRFAALANVPPGAPFFPAAYHSNEEPCFALAIEGAELALQAIDGASTLAEVRQRLVQRVEAEARQLEKIGGSLEQDTGMHFAGVDFTYAPYPDTSRSIGAALERLGVPQAGLAGTLAAITTLTEALDWANYRRAGFNGLMLPVLEDSILAARATQGLLSVNDLLLFSTVCGTGLDTLPLPGDTTADQIAAILLDLAALSLRLDKPLTARLMPIPGKKAGDPTTFNFDYFAPSRVLSVHAGTLTGLLSGNEIFELHARPRSF
jgi:uncharacterized protein (UPF0210 family)